MKTKPMWGLWLLMIAAPIALFWGVRTWQRLFIGEAQLSTQGMSPANMQSGYAFSFKYRNNSSLPFEVRRFIMSGSEEILDWNGKKPNWKTGKNGVDIGRCTSEPYDGEGDCGIYDVKRNRIKTVVVRLVWKHGDKWGGKTLTLTPQMKPQN